MSRRLLPLATLVALALLTRQGAADDVVKGVAQPRDAVTIALSGARFRLDGIDPPDKQSCGEATCETLATAALGKRLEGRETACTKLRRLGHGYFLARCRLEGDSDLANLVVSDGWAVPAPGAAPGLVDLAEQAKAGGKGVWGY